MERSIVDDTCEECGGELLPFKGEAVCSRCGLVNGLWFTAAPVFNSELGSVSMRSYEMKKLRELAWEVIKDVFRERDVITPSELVSELENSLPDEVSKRTIYSIIDWFKNNGYIEIHKTIVLEPKIRNVYLKGIKFKEVA